MKNILSSRKARSKEKKKTLFQYKTLFFFCFSNLILLC